MPVSTRYGRIVLGKPYRKSRAKKYVMCSLGRNTACYGVLGERAGDVKGKDKRGLSKKVALFPIFLDIEKEEQDEVSREHYEFFNGKISDDGREPFYTC